MGRPTRIAVLLALFTTGALAGTEKGPPPTYPPEAAGIDTVRVRSQRLEKAARWRRETAFVTVIDAGDARPGDDAAALLDRAPGVQTRRYGGLGAYGMASLRGSAPGQVQVYWDDVPLLTGADPAVNLSLLPLTAVSGVEVHRSGTPAGLQGAASPGVIRFLTSGADGETDAASTRAGLSAGSFGALGTRAVHRFRRDRWNGTLALGSLESRGDFEYLDRHGTPENPDDDRVTRRTNNGLRQSDYLARLAKTFGGGARIQASTQALNREAGIPGLENIQTRRVRDRYDRRIHALRVESPALLDQMLRLSARGSLQRTRDRFSNPDGEVGLGRADRDDRTEQDSWGASASWVWFATGQSLSFAWDEVNERFTSEDRLRDRKEFTRRRDGTTFTVEDRSRFLDDRILLDLAYRWVRTTDNYTGQPAFGRPPEPFPPHETRIHGPSTGVRLDLGGNTFLKANRTWFGRLPTFFELFGSNGIQDPNPALEPEEGWQADLGLQAERPGPAGSLVLLDLTAFRNRTDKRIATIQNSQRTTKSVNLDESQVDGLEIQAELRRVSLPLRTKLGLRISATFQDARDTGSSPIYDGKELPYVPPRMIDAELTLVRAGWRATYGLEHESATFRDRFNTEAHRTPARTLHHVILSSRFWKERIEISLQLANLTDARTVDAEGYPLPGRAWFTSADFHWE